MSTTMIRNPYRYTDGGRARMAEGQARGIRLSAERRTARAAVRRVLDGAELLSSGGLAVLPETERRELLQLMAAFVEDAQAS